MGERLPRGARHASEGRNETGPEQARAQVGAIRIGQAADRGRVEPEADPDAAERQIARLRAAGLVGKADQVVRIRRFGDGPVSAPMIDGKAVELPGDT